jgi:hypothetical protein
MPNRSERPSAGGISRAATSTAAPRPLRLLICALAICALGAAPGVAGAAPSALSADAATVKLGVVPNGEGTVTLDPLPAGTDACVGSPDTLESWGSPDELMYCEYEYDRGQEVTLTAVSDAAGIDFVGWSDARCAGTGPSCTLRMDADLQSVTALYTPQRVKVAFGGRGTGTVTTQDGRVCTPGPEGQDPWFFNCGTFPLMSQVTLRASGRDVTPTWAGALCEPPAPKEGEELCTLSVYGVRWGSVGFDDKPGGDFSPTVHVYFRVLKQGSGSGTVRSRSIDCGRRCSLDDLFFGDRETLVADAAPGSTFEGWRGACSSAPRCSLAVGPVTTVVAVFDASGDGGSSHPAPEADPRPSRTSARFIARLKRTAVIGRGRHRSILMRVQVNAPSSVRAVLRRGRHRVAGRRWRVHAGTPLLRLRVPARARPGRYRLRLTLRDGSGHVTHVGRRVRLPR